MHTEAKTSVLENELEACQMLLEEEPDNKCKFLYFYLTVVLYFYCTKVYWQVSLVGKALAL